MDREDVQHTVAPGFLIFILIKIKNARSSPEPANGLFKKLVPCVLN